MILTERMVEYEVSELDEIALAYAVSIHKSQGSEYKAVVIPLAMAHYMMLERNLLYTGADQRQRISGNYRPAKSTIYGRAQ